MTDEIGDAGGRLDSDRKMQSVLQQSSLLFTIYNIKSNLKPYHPHTTHSPMKNGLVTHEDETLEKGSGYASLKIDIQSC